MTPLEIATKAHAGQFRRDEKTPYLNHVLDVASAFRPDSWEYDIALLHDVVEDTEWSLDDLLNAGVESLTVSAVDALTKRKGETYEQYLERVSMNDWALRVKLVDISENLADDPTPRQVAKYAKAIRFLAQSIDFGQK